MSLQNAQDEERVGLRLLNPLDVPAVESSNKFDKREIPHPGRCPRGTRGHQVIMRIWISSHLECYPSF